jgi:hypothetical protein
MISRLACFACFACFAEEKQGQVLEALYIAVSNASIIAYRCGQTAPADAAEDIGSSSSTGKMFLRS